MISLDFEQRTTSQRLNKNIFTLLFKRGLKILAVQSALRKLFKNFKTGALHLVIVNDREIAKLNRDYRGKAKPTDVLSFSYIDESNFPGENLIGEIVISLPTACKQARDHRKTLTQELQFLFVHGLLHIFGYDHEKPSERKIMFDLQDNILGTQMWRKLIE